MAYNHLSIEEMLKIVDEPHQSDSMRFIEKNRRLFDTSRGSAIKHQWWDGGYRDHITEVMNIAMVTYRSLSVIRPLPFSLSDALFGCFLHDIEKVWKHAVRPEDRKEIDKDQLLRDEFHLTDDHWNAVHYAHGEGEDYHPTKKVQGPLAAFVHHCDNTSARIWFNHRNGPSLATCPSDEYEYIVETYYPDKLDQRIADRMLELEQIIYTDKERQTLVPDEFRRG